MPADLVEGVHRFGDLPDGVECDGSGFAEDCSVELGPVSLAAIRDGRLRIRIWRQGAVPMVRGALIRIDAVAGNIQIGIGSDGCRAEFAPRSSGSYDLRMWRGSTIVIGERTTSNGTRIVCDDSDFACGEDCMFSDGVLIQAADQHGIVDVETRQIVNGGRQRVVLHDHVWLGRGCIVMPGVRIGDGAIIGTGAIVTGDIDRMCIAAGLPARIIKRGFTWCRNPEVLDDEVVSRIEAWTRVGAG